MMYTVTDTVNKISLKKINPDVLTAGIISLDELKENYSRFGFYESTVAECSEESDTFRSTIDVYDDYSFGIITVINPNESLEIRDRIGFYIKKNLFLMIKITDDDNSMDAILDNSMNRFNPYFMTLEKIIYGVFERMITNDNKVLEKLEFEIDALEDSFEEGNAGKEFNRVILTYKKRLLILRSYYEQLIDVGEELQENENDIFSEEDLRFFKIFTDKAQRLSNNVQMLRENLIQLRDAYNAQLDYNINSIMKVFTVITTIFLPLTLIVGWYGMNFTTMPELTWKYGYIGVILLSAAVVTACIIYFKHKKLF